MRPISSFLFSVFAIASAKARQCKLLPGDSAWPSPSTWSDFNSSISGHLVQTVPIGSPCYTGDEAACEDVKARWTTPELHEESSSSVMHPIFANHSCSPFNDIKTGDVCEVGSYVSYAVDVHTPDDVQKALKFAKEHNIRVVVRNTGHDYMGRSTGEGGLAIWMHHLREISWPSETSVKVQAGVLGHEALEQAYEHDQVVVVGGCPTVGYAGGFTAGGGYGMLSGQFGLSAEQTLEFEVITAEGEFLTASPQENKELYRALSGGGAGTYAIVWSMTIRSHPNLPVALAKLSFPTNMSSDTASDILRTHVAHVSALTELGIFVNMQYFAPVVNFPLIVWYNHTQEELDQVTAPFLSAVANITEDYIYDSREYDTFLDMYSVQGLENTPIAIFLFGGRIIPQTLLQSGSGGKLEDVMDYYLTEGISFFYTAFRLPENADRDRNAVSDAWRDSEGFLIPLLSMGIDDTEEMFKSKTKQMTDVVNQPLVEITDGAYTNEADPDDPSWPTSFFGPSSQYNRLLQVKDTYDPDGVLYGHGNVGSERWAENENGRLCTV